MGVEHYFSQHVIEQYGDVDLYKRSRAFFPQHV